MTPAQLAAAGQRLYGKRWQTPLARHLGVNPRTVRRWAAGTIEVPHDAAEEINSLLVAGGHQRIGEWTLLTYDEVPF